ncbi:MAG: hypothetical protein VR72_08715 [Clostridiaceae bacterium BRH_c20a]|nr:MAG: hypothetical protein VR72_08715 [Clostridiaceae bacterium BRH_c20a]
MDTKQRRIWEIDLLRALAIILMSYFHLIYDLSEFYDFNIDYTRGIIYFIGKTSALIFIVLTGFSCSLSSNNLKRGIKVIFFALIISGVTYLYDYKTYINFGILHLLGTSILLYLLFKKLKPPSLLFLGTLLLFFGKVTNALTISNNFLVPFGITSPYYTALDYYPLLPYLGVFLYGIALRKILYPERSSLFKISFWSKPLELLSNNSLLIYLIHQPILLGILFILKKLLLLA